MTVADDIATLRRGALSPREWKALDRVEAEIARLREQDSKWDTTYRQSRDEIRRLEVEVARLRDGLRRIAPYDLHATDWDYHGYRLVPSGIADELIEHIEHARALLAEEKP